MKAKFQTESGATAGDGVAVAHGHLCELAPITQLVISVAPHKLIWLLCNTYRYSHH